MSADERNVEARLVKTGRVGEKKKEKKKGLRNVILFTPPPYTDGEHLRT